MTTYSQLLGIFPTDLSTPEKPTAQAVLRVVTGYGDEGVLASVLRNRFRKASADHVMGLVSSLHSRGAVEVVATGRISMGHPVVRIRVADGATAVLDPMAGLRGRIVKALAGGPLSGAGLANRLRPTTEAEILDELRAMHAAGLTEYFAKGKYVYTSAGRARRNTARLFGLKSR